MQLTKFRTLATPGLGHRSSAISQIILTAALWPPAQTFGIRQDHFSSSPKSFKAAGNNCCLSCVIPVWRIILLTVVEQCHLIGQQLTICHKEQACALLLFRLWMPRECELIWPSLIAQALSGHLSLTGLWNFILGHTSSFRSCPWLF